MKKKESSQVIYLKKFYYINILIFSRYLHYFCFVPRFLKQIPDLLFSFRKGIFNV